LGVIYKGELTGLLSPGTLNNFVEGTLIPEAERVLDGYVGRREGTLRHFNPHNDQTVTLDGPGKRVLFIPTQYCPWLGLGTVNINGSAVGNVSDVKVHEQFVQYDGGVFSEGAHNIELIGSCGYALVPSDVEYITAQLTSNVLLDMVRRRVADNVVSTDFATVQAALALFGGTNVFTDDMKANLKTYRIKWVDLG